MLWVCGFVVLLLFFWQLNKYLVTFRIPWDMFFKFYLLLLLFFMFLICLLNGLQLVGKCYDFITNYRRLLKHFFEGIFFLIECHMCCGYLLIKPQKVQLESFMRVLIANKQLSVRTIVLQLGKVEITKFSNFSIDLRFTIIQHWIT